MAGDQRQRHDGAQNIAHVQRQSLAHIALFRIQRNKPPQRTEYTEHPAADNAGFLQRAQAFIVLGRHDENAGGDDGDHQHGKVQRAELAHALIAGF